MVSVISQCSQTISVDFLEFLLKRTTFEEFKEILEQIHVIIIINNQPTDKVQRPVG